MTMSANFVSTQYLASALVAPVQQAQAQLATATTEMSTGQYASLGLQLGDQSGYELSLREQVQRLQAFTAGASVVSTNLSTAQDALTSISSRAQTTVQNLATWTAAANSGAQLQTMGQTALQELTSSANATSGDVYVFGGTNSSEAPLNDYYATDSTAGNAVAAAFEKAFGFSPASSSAATITSSQMQSFLSSTSFTDLFSGTGWTSNWSGATNDATTEIAPGETATTTTSINASTLSGAPSQATTAFQNLTEAYTMLAAFGGSSLSASAQQAVASTATTLISRGQSALTDTQATLGATQSQVTDANDAMSSQLTVIESQVNALDDPDPTALSAKITSLTNQIQMAYELTARLQQLNLAQYLPVP